MNTQPIRQLVTALLSVATLVACAQTAFAKEDPKARLAKAEAMFAERCKKAGVFIHRTAENVDGVLLLKIRDRHNHYDQYRMSDPYGHDSTGDDYLKSFLVGRDKNGWQTTTRPIASKGYRYVEAIDNKDGKRYRYTGRIEQPWLRDKRYGEWVREFVLDKTSASGPTPRYGVTFDDISTREDRDYWIAGSSLKVIDLQTKEVMAERIGYMMDRGQGNTSAGRSPWLLAANYACPEFPQGQRHKYQVEQTRRFVEKSLKPIQD